MGDRITYVALDFHKEGIIVAMAEGGLRSEVREYGRIANTPAAVGMRLGYLHIVRRVAPSSGGHVV